MLTADCGFNDAQRGPNLLEERGAVIGVDIGYDPTYKTEDKAPPTPGIKTVTALIDTGADQSCIDDGLAAKLGLQVIDRLPLGGVHGVQLVNIYNAQVHVPRLKFTAYGPFAGVDLTAGGSPFEALLGRTFLRHFSLAYDGKLGTASLTRDD